jgi:hypothetical protein
MSVDTTIGTVAPAGAKGRARTVRAAELSLPLLADVLAAGCERLVVADPVATGVDADADLRLLRFLREATTATLRVEWTLAGRPLVAARDLTHLVPPRTGVDAEATACVSAWRAAYRYGSYHYRQGPDFVTVKDIRPDGPPVHLTIDGDGATHFRALAQADTLADLAPEVADALNDAVEFGLAVRGVTTFLVLPIRMRIWPVPYVAA